MIELLVVIAIIAILAAIAIPIFWNQREKAYISHIQATLKNGATAMESWAVGHSGSYEELDGQNSAALEEEGFKIPEWAANPGYLTIEANDSEYCLQAQHHLLSNRNEWRRSTYSSSVGRPTANPDQCPNL